LNKPQLKPAQTAGAYSQRFKNQQVGGAFQTTPRDQGPFKTNEKAKIDKDRQAERPWNPPAAPTPQLDLKLYPPPKPMGGKPQTSSPFPVQIPVSSIDPNGYIQPLYYPEIKTYNISVNDINGSYAKLHHVFEDVLPIKDDIDTMTTLNERKQMTRFIRGVLVKQQDGEMVSFDSANVGLPSAAAYQDGPPAHNLLSHLKVMELNPYHWDPHYNNPLKSLPYGFLLYRSAYPLRYNQSAGNVEAAKRSTGVNLRIYRLSMGELMAREDNSYKIWDSWRDIGMYEYIREKILNAGVCPNFVLMHSWYRARATIDFDTLSRIGGNGSKQWDSEAYRRAIQAAKATGSSADPAAPYGPGALLAKMAAEVQPAAGPREYKASPYVQVPVQGSRKTWGADPKGLPTVSIRQKQGDKVVKRTVIDVNPSAYSGQVLVALTEAPNYNILQWATKMYQRDININRMVNTGSHDDYVWESVSFQLMAGLYTMWKHGIAISNMTLEDNVFIKDLRTNPSASAGYWRYRIDGIDYYVQNCGYLVQIDNNYRDLNSERVSIMDDDPGQIIRDAEMASKSIRERHRVYYGEPYTMDSLRKLVLANMYNLLNRNRFGKEFAHRDGVAPGPKILGWLDGVQKTLSEPDGVTQLFYKNCRSYMHTRIGTLLLEKEVPYIRKGALREFRKGELVVQETSHDNWIWVLYVDTRTTNDPDLGERTMARILTKSQPEDQDTLEKEVSLESLLPYAKTETIVQDYKGPERKVGEEDLLETYVL
jgi:hypothetical protein